MSILKKLNKKEINVLFAYFNDKESEPQLIKIIYEYINQGIYLNFVNANSKTLLMLAVINNMVELVQLLIDYKCNTETHDYKGKTALMYAFEKNYTNIILILLKTCNVNEPSISTKLLPIEEAIKKNNQLIFDMLLNCDCDVSGKYTLNYMMHSTLMWILSDDNNKKNPSIIYFIKKLIEYDIDSINKSPYTLLGFAVQWGWITVVKLLVENGASIFTNDNSICPSEALRIAIKNNNIDIVDYLINIRHNDNSSLWSPGDGVGFLSYAILTGSVASANKLLSHNVNFICTTDRKSYTGRYGVQQPIEFALKEYYFNEKNWHDVIEKLIDKYMEMDNMSFLYLRYEEIDNRNGQLMDDMNLLYKFFNENPHVVKKVRSTYILKYNNYIDDDHYIFRKAINF